MRNRFNEEDDLLSDLNELMLSEVAPEVQKELEAKIEEVEVVEEEHILIPLDYQIFSTHNNEPTGKREIIDTYRCDRVRGITPSGKVRIKADLMKKAFANKKFFVEETSSKIYENGRVKTISRIYYQTK